MRLPSVLALTLAASAPAAAQGQHCAPWHVMRDQLAARFGETPVGVAMIDGQWVLQVLASGDGSTVSVVVVSASGLACMVAVGRDWEAIEPPAKPADERKS